MNGEASTAQTRMDLGKDLTKIWRRLDEYVTTDGEERCSKIRMDACEMANRLHVAQTGLAEAVYRREWNDEWSPLLSLLIPGTRSGGLSGCRFEHPDEHSNGPMSSLRLRMHSLDIEWPQRMHDGDWLVLRIACRENVSRTRRPAPGMETLCDCEGEFGP